MPEHTQHIAVYGHVNLNLIDGSSIWLTSLLKTLAISEDTRLTVLLAAPNVRRLLTDPLQELAGLEIISPPGDSQRKIHPIEAIDTLEELDDHGNFDAIILRGFSVCTEAASRSRFNGRLWCYLTDIPQNREDMTEKIKEQLSQIAGASQYILCQTEQLRSFIETHVPNARRKTALLPPMIPEPAKEIQKPQDGTKRLVYAGKFAPLWAFEELLECFSRLRHEHGDVELHVFGDKIHNPPDDPDYLPRVQRALSHTDGLVWHQGTTREQVMEALGEMDLAWGWRREGLDDNLELSTKILEYGASGVPVVLSRNNMHEDLLGAAYPLMANSSQEAYEVCEMLWSDKDAIAEASSLINKVSLDFTFSNIYARRLSPLLRRMRSMPSVASKTMLIAGHDLRFIQSLSQLFKRRGYRVLLDKWTGHDRHDEAQSRRLLEQADLVVSEWCLGNAVWLSENLRPDQRLIVRLHLQERDTEYPAKVKMDAVDRVIFVGPHILEEVQGKFHWPADKLMVISNFVDVLDFDRKKLDANSFNLGISGICPARKRLDLAVDILENLRTRDNRFKLYVKGKMPWEYDWLWKRPDERSYYERIFERIERSELLRNAICFDGYGEDIATWYRKIAFILSTSDFESFHLAIAEGAVSGAVPVILNWQGADEIYPESWVHSSASQAAGFIYGTLMSGELLQTARTRSDYAKDNFSLDVIFKQWCEVLEK